MKKKTSIRKGCVWCAAPLNTFKEKVTRACNDCAEKTLQGAQKISEGKVKDGLKEMKEVVTSRFGGKAVLDEKIRGALTSKQKKIIKRAKKQGISEEEAIQALNIFDGKKR